MMQMVLLSTFMHLLFIGILSVFSSSKSERITYTPVYTVNLVSLSSVIKPSSPKQVQEVKPVELLSEKKKNIAMAQLTALKKNAEKQQSPERGEVAKPVELLSGKKKSAAMAKLTSLGKSIEKEKSIKKKTEIEESDVPEMLAALDKIAKAETESGLIDDSKERKEKILEELAKLEEGLSIDKNSRLDFEKTEKSKSLEQLEELEKKWEEENATKPHPFAGDDESGINEALARLQGTVASVSKPQQPFAAKDESGINEASSKIAGTAASASISQPFAANGESGINETLAKLAGTVTSVSNQSENVTPSYLSIYFSFIRNKAFSQWKNPSGIEILSEKETNMKTVVSFNIIRGGRIENYKIHKSSGNRILDDLALAAVKNSDPLPPLPAEYYDSFLRVFLDFNYALK